jgi:hypothetical protein
MTITDRREATIKWFSLAPPIVVLTICLSAVGALSSWTYLIAHEVREQRTITAVAVEKAEAARSRAESATEVAAATATNVDQRLNRLEDKIDRLLELNGAQARPRRERTR